MVEMSPNETVVRARVARRRPAADGWGCEADLIVLRVLTSDTQRDFIRPQIGSHLSVFVPPSETVEEGTEVIAELSTGGGPFGPAKVRAHSITAAPNESP
jgi:hypothetical protein